MLDGGDVAQVRAITIQQERKVHAALQYAASFHCLVEESARIVKRSNQSQKRKKWKQGSIDWNGVRLQANIVA